MFSSGNRTGRDFFPLSHTSRARRSLEPLGGGREEWGGLSTYLLPQQLGSAPCMAFEELLDRAGGMGLFQVLQICTLFLPALLTPAHLLLENFSAAIPDHRCWAHILDNSSEVPANLTHEALLAIAIPPDPNLKPHQCRRFHRPQWQLLDTNATVVNRSEAATEPCVDGWVYDHSTFTSTIVTKWDLVCSSQSMKPLGQSILMAGILAGSFVWGLLSHRLGRKPMLSWCCLQVAVADSVATWAPNFFIYCGLRFLSAFGLAGVILAQSTLSRFPGGLRSFSCPGAGGA